MFCAGDYEYEYGAGAEFAGMFDSIFMPGFRSWNHDEPYGVGWWSGRQVGNSLPTLLLIVYIIS